MATLNAAQRALLRREVAADRATQDWTKARMDAGLQAIEDWFEDSQASLGAAINAATSPFVFPPAVKARMVIHWLRMRFDRDR